MQDDIYDVLTPREVMDLSTIEQNAYENTEKFGLNKHNLKNRDHCHKTGLVFIIV